MHTCLCRAGLLLELNDPSALLTKGTDGKPLFDDAQTGVVLDWDRRTRDATSVNEIDVLLTRGMIPIFDSRTRTAGTARKNCTSLPPLPRASAGGLRRKC